MSWTRILSLFVLAMLVGASCRDPIQPPPPPIHEPTIVLSVQSVASTEADLRIHFTDTVGIKAYTLFRNGEPVSMGAARYADAVISDTTLLRGHAYAYRAYGYGPNRRLPVDSSALVSARTLDTAGISVTPVDVGVTDAYVQLTMNDRNPIRGFVLKRDGGAILTGNLTGRDTVIYDTGLTQAHPYSYKIFRTYNGSTIDSSIPAVATTLDTTTHNFTWEVDTLGYLTSSLFDVAIVNDNDFWVVGSLWGRDSADYRTGNTYCAAEWTPGGWDYKRFYYPVPQPGGGTAYLAIGEARSILYFSANDFWLDCRYHWDGTKIIPAYVQIAPLLDSNDAPGRVIGTSSSNVWTYGGGGAVLHFDGASWEKIPSGIESELSDACESPDGKTVWFCGWKDFQPTSLLRYRDGRMETIYNSADRAYQGDPNRITGATMSVWTNSNYRIFPLTWYALFRASANTQGEGKAIPISGVNAYWSYQRIRANGVNDMVVAGPGGTIWHYNGKAWRSFTEIFNQYDRLHSVAIKGNFIVAVGERNYDGIHRYGLVWRGRRN